MKSKDTAFKIVYLITLMVLFSCIRDRKDDPHVNSQYYFLTHNGVKRTYLLHLPPSYQGNTESIPLVLALHGGGGSPTQFEESSRLSEKADNGNFIVVYPQGAESEGLLKLKTWNAGNCCGKNSADDIGFIVALIKELSSKYRVNTKKIYATGHSNGGMMCYRIAAELSSQIAAIAPNACSMQVRDAYAPSRNVPVIHIHSKLDKDIPYEGGVGTGISNHYNPPLDSSLNVVARRAQCISGKQLIAFFPLYSTYKWNNCSDVDFQVLLFLTEDGGHTWPGGLRGSRINDDEISQAFINNDIIWDFFQKYSLP